MITSSGRIASIPIMLIIMVAQRIQMMMMNVDFIAHPTLVIAVYLIMDKHVVYYKIGCEICSVVPEHLSDEGS